jgi:hypothetical protein
MSADSGGLVFTRWRRYGKDRLYVDTADGGKVGFWDLVADIGHPTAPEHEAALVAATARWRTLPPDTEDVVPAVSPSVSPLVVGPPAEGPDPVRTGPDSVPSLGNTGETDDTAETAETAEPADAVETNETDETEEGVEDDEAGPGDGAEPTPTWIDLADNRAGAEARRQALAAREAAPVKTLVARILRVHTDERAWRIGADGEERVASSLAKVARKDPRWRFLHAIPVGERGSDIDHLVIGPAGVFSVNAKHHPRAKIWVAGNTLLVNGARQPYIRNSRHEAARATKLLTAACGFPVQVHGLIVTVGADDVVIKEPPEDVHVVPRIQVARWLRRRGGDHESATLDAIYEAARRSTTWRAK